MRGREELIAQAAVEDVTVAAAGVAGITSVLLVLMLSAPRVFLAMARDGMVPKHFFADVRMDFQEIIAGTVGRENTYGTIVGKVKAWSE